MTTAPPEDDGRVDHAALADKNAAVAITGLRNGADAMHVATAMGIAQVHATLELAHQAARIAAALHQLGQKEQEAGK